MDNCVSDWTSACRRRVGLLIVIASIAFSPGISLAENDAIGTAKEGGIGVAAALTSLVYGPIKVAYATGGAMVAGFAWVFSGGDSELASTVLTRAVRGTYVITPETITGEREIEFVGRSPEYRSDGERTQVAAAPEGW